MICACGRNAIVPMSGGAPLCAECRKAPIGCTCPSVRADAPKPQGHNYDCALCGAPCPFAGHEGCPKGGGFTTTKVVRCFDHGKAKVGIGKAEPAPVKKKSNVYPLRDWHPAHWSAPERKPKPIKTEPVTIVDTDLLALLDGEVKKAEDAVDAHNEP